MSSSSLNDRDLDAIRADIDRENSFGRCKPSPEPIDEDIDALANSTGAQNRESLPSARPPDEVKRDNYISYLAETIRRGADSMPLGEQWQAICLAKDIFIQRSCAMPALTPTDEITEDEATILMFFRDTNVAVWQQLNDTTSKSRDSRAQPGCFRTGCEFVHLDAAEAVNSLLDGAIPSPPNLAKTSSASRSGKRVTHFVRTLRMCIDLPKEELVEIAELLLHPPADALAHPVQLAHAALKPLILPLEVTDEEWRMVKLGQDREFIITMTLGLLPAERGQGVA
jgi:hypothetical protein